MIKRVLALGLALLVIVALMGCGANKRQIIELTLSTEDAEAILAAAGIRLPDPATAPGANSTIVWYSWYDDFHAYSEGEVVNTGYFTFKNFYGCEIDWVECTWDERFTRVAALVLGGTPPDFYNGETENFPYYAIHNVFQPINDYIDLDDPLWDGISDYMRKYFSLGDDVYLLCTDLFFGSVMAYNRRVIEDYGFDDPAELFYDGEWTWDAFEEMAMDFSDEELDQYALDGWFYAGAFQRASGAPIVTYDLETEKFVSNMDDPRLERANDFLYNLNKNGCIFPWFNNGYQVRNQGASSAADYGDGLKEGQLLFSTGGPYFFTGPVDEISMEYADVTAGELMFVPIPRDPQGDGINYVESDPAGYSIIQDAPNPEGVALLAMCDRFKVIDPTVISIDKLQKIEKYLWTDEMLEMYDYCVEMANNSESVILAYDAAGFGGNLFSTIDTIEKNGMQLNTSTWAQIKEANSDMLQYYLDDINAEIEGLLS